MNIWFVSPAWRRYDITRLVLRQRRWLCDVLASRGWEANCVIVADDRNLNIAHELGFPTIVMDNDHGLGRRFNAGFKFAAESGADIFVHIGSDDWVNPAIFDEDCLPEDDEICASRRIDFVNVETGKLRRGSDPGAFGSIPWLIPRAIMEPSGFTPVQDHVNRGIEYSLVGGLGVRPIWLFRREDLGAGCVDFKSQASMTEYAGTWTLGAEEIDAWPVLAEDYPEELVALARQTHEDQKEA